MTSPSLRAWLLLFIVSAAPMKRVWAACDASYCQNKVDSTIAVGKTGATPDCACVLQGKVLAFSATVPGDQFAAVFGKKHPFANATHRVHTESYFSSDTLSQTAIGAYKYTSCHLEDDSPPCHDPKVFVKPVGQAIVTSDTDEIRFGQVEPKGSELLPAPPAKITNNRGGNHLKIAVKSAASGVFQLSDNKCTGMVVPEGQSCTFQVKFTPDRQGLFVTSAQVTVNHSGSDQRVVLSIPISGTGK